MRTLEQQTKRAALFCLVVGAICIIASQLTGCGAELQSPAAPVAPTLEGYWSMPNGGYVDLYQDAEGMYTARSIRLVMTNADGSTGLIPTASTAALPLTNNSLYYTTSIAYVAATNNVKQDSNNVLLAATYLTQLIFSSKNGSLQVRVIVSTNSGVLFDHTVISQ